jgi:molybdate transport system permease protein
VIVRRRWTDRALGGAGYALGGGMLVFLVLPVVALFVTSGPSAWLAGLRHPMAVPALILSLSTTAISLVVVLAFGTPLAWWLARAQSRAARFVETCVQLPIVVPPAVAGLALLLTFGRNGLVGPLLGRAGVALAFTTAAVVLAQTFVAAPFYVQAATASFTALDENLLIVARSLGASRARVLFRVALPIARRGLVAGAALAWARALGEFGATLMFAGNLEGRTQTLPLAVYTALESDLRAAQALSVVLVVVAIALLALLRPRRPR